MRVSGLCFAACRRVSLHQFVEPRVHPLPREGPALNQHCVLTSNSHDIFENLAAEEALLRGVLLDKGSTILFLYVNAPCVVVGRNQNVVEEVALRRSFGQGIDVARRSSGGGAVYHDMGNLCFSFFTHRVDYAPEKTIQLVRLGLCAQYGIAPVRLTSSKRHDLYLDGKKITGSAMRVQRDIAFHHCTLLVDSDRQRLGQFLRSEADLVACTSPAVGSVRSTVTTLEVEGVLPPVPRSPAVSAAHGRVQALEKSISHFYLAHIGTVLAHPTPSEISPEALRTTDHTASLVLDVKGAAEAREAPYRMLYANGRMAPASDSTTLTEEIARTRTRDWLFAMPRYATHTQITRDELAQWLRRHRRWSELTDACDLPEQDVAEELLVALLDSHEALHLRATVDHRAVQELQAALGASLTTVAAQAPPPKVDETWKHTSMPLPWLDAFFAVAVVGEMVDASFAFATGSPLLSGFLLEAHEAFVTRLDLPAAALDLSCEVLLAQVLACWQHKNVVDL